MIIAFISIEKTAGQSTNFILRNSFGINHCDAISTNGGYFTKEELELTKKIYPNLKSIAGHRVVPFNDIYNEKNKSNIFFFTFIRDPMVRCTSHYQFVKQIFPNITPNFKDWISKKENQNLQCRKLSGYPSFEKAKAVIDSRISFVGLLNEYKKSLEYLAKITPHKINLHAKVKNIASDNSIKEKILASNDLNLLLTEANLEDLKLYNYIKEEYFPKQIERIGKQNHCNIIFSLESKTENYKSILFRNVIYKPFISLRYILENKTLNFNLEQMEGVNFASMNLYSKFDYFRRKFTHKILNIK